MRLHVGCAQWTHKAWPVSAGEKLRSYAEWCNAVEGNTTFYATPSRETTTGWADQAPEHFRFVLKFPRKVTHDERLGASGDEARRIFLEAIEPLGERIHALWIQLPASFGPSDLSTLDGFLRRQPGEYRYAVEVRHPTFADNPRDLHRILSGNGAELVPFDTSVMFASPPTSEAERDAWSKKPRLPVRPHALTDFPIVRYLGRDDPARTVEGWQRWLPVIARWLREGRSPTVFVHTPDNAEAPSLARRFHAEVAALVPGLEPLPEPQPTTLF
ncbi:DUF72 domain-containing protein [Paractinoplanes brasiliensis]|uniref:Uncharacterized protein YecE (DUF72 family) n=1 Tax=Paractinoplanes brasiliensis TaxID=52695 RepID=A0A4R6J781_9ACTN|nr:DUF72 domain-containing protein [Actinoplanes brasiliensis]TDO31364.1 uncharacterized protein YecE (DUF72 family) [Actinoplanes brasiliensis]GID28306.1 hypothetical protein Abr02nite_32890 [Actinoplanes brasiliensis]